MIRRLILAATLALTACGDSPTEPADTLPGSFEIETYNGEALPVVARLGGQEAELLSWEIEVRADGTYRESVRSRTVPPVEPHEVTSVDEGTWGPHGLGTFRFEPSGPGTSFVGAWEPPFLTIDDGRELVFRRVGP